MDNKTESPESVSYTIRTSRKGLGMSQKELANLCGLSQSMIARLEGDIKKLNPSYSVVYSVMKKLEELSSPESRLKTFAITASSIMHRNVTALKPDDSVEKAIHIIKNYDFLHIPVIDDSRMILGTIHQKDLLDIATKNPNNIKSIKVRIIMSPSLPQVDKGTSLAVLKPIIEGSGSVLVTEKGQLLGIITAYDVLKLV